MFLNYFIWLKIGHFLTFYAHFLQFCQNGAPRDDALTIGNQLLRCRHVQNMLLKQHAKFQVHNTIRDWGMFNRISCLITRFAKIQQSLYKEMGTPKINFCPSPRHTIRTVDSTDEL